MMRNRNFVIQNMRVILTLLVVLHHTAISYTTHKIAALVIDSASTPTADYMVGYLDKFFMSAFFWISGMFVVHSIKKRGSMKFIKSRALRLGLPFIFGWLILNVPAYYIQYISGIKVTVDASVQLSFSGFMDFIAATFGMGAFSGHLWFLWVLLAFNVVSALVIGLLLKFRKSETPKNLLKRPGISIMIMLLVLSLVYWPMASVGNGWFVAFYGPFIMQANRLFLYLTFYIFGIMIGSAGVENTFLSPEKIFIRGWWLQLSVALIAYYFAVVNTRAMFADPTNTLAPQIVSGLFPLIALFGTLALYSFIARYLNKELNVLRVLNRDSFGIYIFHYVIVTMWQYNFLGFEGSALLKIILVFWLTLITSVIITELVRRIPGIRKLI